MKTYPLSLAVTAIVMILAVTPSHATLTTAAWYKLGEDDPGALANTTGQNPTQDSSVNNLDLTRVSGPTNRADAAYLSFGSTLSMQFNGTSDGYFGAAPAAPGLASNVGLEAWVKPNVANDPDNGIIVFNGTGFNGYGLLQQGGNLVFYIGNAASTVSLGAVTPGQWIHLGLVIGTSGNITGYTNGVVAGTGVYSVLAPTSQLAIGAGGTFVTPVSFFDGRVDQVRVFSYTGAFSTADFLIGVPEPSTAMLLGIGGLLVWRRRPRSAG